MNGHVPIRTGTIRIRTLVQQMVVFISCKVLIWINLLTLLVLVVFVL